MLDVHNWINNSHIKEALHLLAQHNVSDREQLLYVYEGIINQEFDKIIQTFLQKVQETKEKIMKNAREMYTIANINLEDFKTGLGSLYDIDSLIELLQSFESGQRCSNTVNREICTLFETIHTKKDEEKTLEDIAKNVTSFAKYYLEVDPRPFDDLKQRLNLETFDACPFRIWSWHPEVKSASISLENFNTFAQKHQQAEKYSTAVIGTNALSKGVHRWEVEIATRDIEHNWICFGVIETNLVKEVTDFPYCDAVGIDTYGRLHNMDNEGLMVNYDFKTFLCELDMENGTFTISYGGTVVARQRKSLKGKIVVPFADLGEPGNTARLHVLSPV